MTKKEKWKLNKVVTESDQVFDNFKIMDLNKEAKPTVEKPKDEKLEL